MFPGFGPQASQVCYMLDLYTKISRAFVGMEFILEIYFLTRYKISTSGGGGYCDCGDAEAWKTNCFCDKHVPQPVNPSGSVIEDTDLDDIQKRALTLFSFVLEFCHEILTSELNVVLPRDLTLLEKEIELLNITCPSDTFATVLYNDEMHTFDTVIQTLTRAVDCTKRTAEHFAIMIDREGRSIVKCSTFQVEYRS